MRFAALLLLAVAVTPASAAVPAETKDCLMLDRVQEQRIVDDRTILFREGGRWYRSDLAQSCQGLDPEKSLRTTVPSSRLCSGEPMTVFERSSNFTYGACPIGKFARIEAPLPVPRPRE